MLDFYLPSLYYFFFKLLTLALISRKFKCGIPAIILCLFNGMLVWTSLSFVMSQLSEPCCTFRWVITLGSNFLDCPPLHSSQLALKKKHCFYMCTQSICKIPLSPTSTLLWLHASFWSLLKKKKKKTKNFQGSPKVYF